MSDDLVEQGRSVERDLTNGFPMTCEKGRILQQITNRIEELEAKLERAENLLIDAMVQLENGKIKTRRNRAYLIGKFLAELKGETDG